MRTTHLLSTTHCRKAAFGSALLALAVFTSVPGFGQGSSTVLFSAGAYGTSANVGSLVKVARTAPVGIGTGCGTAAVGLNETGTAASVTAGPLVITGVADTRAADTAQDSTGTADLFQLNLLGGLVSASELKSVSNTSIDSSKNLHTSAVGSKFVNLVVAGSRISANPAPNTTIELAGIGRVVLNEQIVSSSSYGAHFTVNALHLYVTVKNLLNIPVGAEVIVSDATSGITKVSGPAAVDAYAYGSQVTGKLIQSSATAPVYVGCRGTNGATVRNSLVGINLPGILSSGTAAQTGAGNVTSTDANSRSSSTVQTLNLLGGLVKANVIQAQASADTADGQSVTVNSSGSFVGLSVAGHPEIKDNVAANTHINIANLGTLYLHRVFENSSGVTVVMIELVVSQSNTLGLPLGADIRVAAAEASIHSVTHP